MLAHDYDAAGREVLIQFPIGTLGDILGWFPYAVRFAERARLPADLRHVGAAHPAVPRRLSGDHASSRTRS